MKLKPWVYPVITFIVTWAFAAYDDGLKDQQVSAAVISEVSYQDRQERIEHEKIDKALRAMQADAKKQLGY